MPVATKTLTAYGVTLPDTKEVRQVLGNPIYKELLFFRDSWKMKGYTGPGAYQHGRNAADMLWRHTPGKETFVWHPDFEVAFEAFCDIGAKGEVVITGPASCGKTTAAAMYSVLFWMSDPQNSAVLVCSTTLPGLRKRVWGEIRKFYLAIESFCGANLVESKLSIESSKGDAKHGIFGVSVGAGDEAKAMGRLIGFHTGRICTICDEATDVPDAIVEAMTNLSTGKQKSVLIAIGNASSIFDSHGKLSEPKEGWGSVDVNTSRWETRRGGVGIHMDGMLGANVLAGRVIYPFLLTKEDIAATIRDYGENSPQFWRMRRGWWCPEGTQQTVLTEPIIQRFQAMTRDAWLDGNVTKWAGLDPAFGGGDRCVLRMATTGKSADGIERMELGESVTIKTDILKTDTSGKRVPIHYQIASQVKSECVARGISPRNFGMDVTGEGGGLASIIAEEWDAGFHQVEFGGKASEMPISEVNNKRCCDEYANRVCELWFAFRTTLMAGQVRGLDAATAMEFCARLFTVENKIKLESKSDMKLRMSGKSPDNADAVVVLMDTIKSRGGLGAVASRARSSMNRSWEKLVAEFTLDPDNAYTEDSMAALL